MFLNSKTVLFLLNERTRLLVSRIYFLNKYIRQNDYFYDFTYKK